MNHVLAILFVLFSQQNSTLSDRIVVTASDLPETIESTPASVTVVTKKEIDDRAARDLVDVLREVPGISVSRTGSLGKSSSLFMRGASSKQTLVLWNGIEINDPYFSGYNWGQFSTAGVERVEVARGPFSSLYGADAVGGVVNIITTGASDRTTIDLAGGGHGLVNGVVSVAQTEGAASFNATVEHRQDDGFAPNDNDRQNSLLGGFTYAASKSLSLGLAGRYANYDLGVPRNTNAFATAYVATPHHREHGKEWQLSVPVTAELGRVHAEAHVAESHRDDSLVDPDAASFGETRSSRRLARVTFRVATAAGTIIAGADGDRSAAANRDNFGLDIDTHHRTSNSLFIEDRLTRATGNGNLDVSLGLRRDHYTTFGSETSPRVAVAWSKNGQKFRAAYGQAFRAPQIGELYLPFFGNPDLAAERSRTTEIGYDRYLRDATLSITAFHNDFTNLIVYDTLANHFANIGKARSKGVELGASDRIGALTLGASYTYLDTAEEPSGEQLLRRPRHSGSLSVGYDSGTIGAQLVVARVGDRRDVNDLFPFNTPVNRGYTKSDLTLRWHRGAIEPYARIENLTNSKYEEVLGYPSPTRRAILGLRYVAPSAAASHAN